MDDCDSGVVPVTVSGTAGTVERYAFEVDVSDYFTNSSSLWAMFVRNGSDVADTYGSSIYMYNMSIHYTKWCIGATGTDHNV